jgi:hypothetical protein
MMINDLFRYAFERFKSVFNAQKTLLKIKKKTPFDKKEKLKTILKVKKPKNKKAHFWHKLKK